MDKKTTNEALPVPSRPLSGGAPLRRSPKLSNISVKFENNTEKEPMSFEKIESSKSPPPLLPNEAILLRKTKKSTDVRGSSNDNITIADNGNVAEEAWDKKNLSEHHSFIIMEAMDTTRPSQAVTENSESGIRLRSVVDRVAERESLLVRMMAKAKTAEAVPETTVPKSDTSSASVGNVTTEDVTKTNNVGTSSVSKSSSPYSGSTKSAKSQTSKSGKGDSLDSNSGLASGDYPKRKKKTSQGSYKTSYQAYSSIAESTKLRRDNSNASTPKQGLNDCVEEEPQLQPIITTKMGAISFKVPGRITHKTTIKIAHYPQPGNEVIKIEEPCESPSGECYEEVTETSCPAGNYSNNCNFATYNIADPNYVSTMAQMQYNPYGNAYYPPYGCWRY